MAAVLMNTKSSPKSWVSAGLERKAERRGFSIEILSDRHRVPLISAGEDTIFLWNLV